MPQLTSLLFKAEGGPIAGQQSARSALPGTAQQESIWCEAVSGEKQMIVEARAGTGKSTTCVEAMWRLEEQHGGKARVAYAVFNRKNKEEMQGRCPPGHAVATLNGHGARACSAALGQVVLEQDKTRKVILPDHPRGKYLPYLDKLSVVALVGAAKCQGLLPKQQDLGKRLREVRSRMAIDSRALGDQLYDLTSWCLRRSAEVTTVLDYDDQVWLPVVLGLTMQPLDVLFVDECQDLNPAQHALIERMAGAGRLVCVGDRFQSLYAFRGADSESMSRLQTVLSARPGGLAEMPLTVCWRCPRSHLDMARAIVPDIEPAPHAAMGDLGFCEQVEAEGRFLSGDMVLCPTNAPLIGMALRLAASGRPVCVLGRDIGRGLLSIVRRASDAGQDRTVAQVAAFVCSWRDAELARLAREEGDGGDGHARRAADQANGLLAILHLCRSPADIERTVKRLFVDDRIEGAVTFSTIHKAKGLEADRTWVLDVPLWPPRQPWDAQQQQNMHYVALTRARQSMTFVSMPD